jgi:heat shock protein HslJ
MKIKLFYWMLIPSLLLAACSGGSVKAISEPTTAAAAGQPAAPVEATSAEAASTPLAETMSAGAESPGANDLSSLAKILGNLSYAGVFPDQQITLKDGYFAYSEGGGGTPHVSLVDRLILTGNLNADEAQDAIFLLEDDSEGSGRLTFLVGVLNVFTDPQPVEAVILGGRSGVKSLAIDGSQVTADIVTQGPGDPDCCASWNVQVVYSLEEGRLVEKSRTERKQISLDDLDGTQWRLVALGADQQAALPENGITLQFDDGQISGFAGCNDYTGAVSSGDYGRNSIKVDSIITTTQKSCSGPVASQEKSFLEALANASAWVYEYGDLALIFGVGDDQVEKLLFEPIDQ